MTLSRLRNEWPIFAVLTSCLVLQRFGVPAGGFQVPLALPITAAVFGILLLQNRVYLSKPGLAQYLLFVGWLSLVAWVSVVSPPKGTSASIPSLWYFLATYCFLVFRWRLDLPLQRTLEIFRGFVSFIAVCGIAQFVLQFVGIRQFQFTGLLPDSVLIESGYNLVIEVQRGSSVLKSNGLFLLEPSFMSQVMAIGIVIEFLYFGSRLRLGLFALGLVTAFSGTGLLILGFALAVAGLVGLESFRRVAKFALVAGVTVFAFSLLAGIDYVDIVSGRVKELSTPNTSGFIRFVSPYAAVADIANDPRWVLGFGAGSGETFNSLGYTYGVNALTKVLIEYGPLGLALYVGYVGRAFYRRELRILSAVGLFWFVFGGGYHLTPSVIYTLAALFTWENVASVPAAAPAVPAVASQRRSAARTLLLLPQAER